MKLTKYLFAERDHRCFLKLKGNISIFTNNRFGSFIKQILSENRYTEFYIDLDEVTNIDSASIGILTKISTYASSHLLIRPVIFCSKNRIINLLKNVGFEDIFVFITDQEDIQSVIDNLILMKEQDITEVKSSLIEAIHIHNELNLDLEKNYQEID